MLKKNNNNVSNSNTKNGGRYKLINKDKQYQENLRIVGNNLREIRQSKNISQTQLAEPTGYTKGAISQFESGIRELGLGAILEIAKQLDTTPEELLKGVK